MKYFLWENLVFKVEKFDDVYKYVIFVIFYY